MECWYEIILKKGILRAHVFSWYSQTNLIIFFYFHKCIFRHSIQLYLSEITITFLKRCCKRRNKALHKISFWALNRKMFFIHFLGEQKIFNTKLQSHWRYIPSNVHFDTKQIRSPKIMFERYSKDICYCIKMYSFMHVDDYQSYI